jgi:hypothetical protein
MPAPFIICGFVSHVMRYIFSENKLSLSLSCPLFLASKEDRRKINGRRKFEYSSSVCHHERTLEDKNLEINSLSHCQNFHPSIKICCQILHASIIIYLKF